MITESVGWFDLNSSDKINLFGGEEYKVRLYDGSEVYADCHVSTEGDEVWFTKGKTELPVVSVYASGVRRSLYWLKIKKFRS